MTRSRKPHGRPAIAVHADEHKDATVRSAQAPPPLPKRIGLVRLAVAAFVCWMIGLVVMALLTANPVVISRDQIALADAIVVARPVPDKHQIRVERVLAGNLATEDVVTVVNLADVPDLAAEMNYVVPLTRFRQDYAITMLKGQRPPPLIYPSTPETIGKARDLLREGGR